MLPLLVLLVLQLHFSGSAITTRHSTHYSDVLKLKCDSLPYRTVFLNANCYFIIDSDNSANKCSSIFPGAKLTGKAPDEVWSSLFADKSQFVNDGESAGKTKAMCLYESGYRCSTGQSTSIAGRCIHKGDKKMNYRQAENFCAKVGSLPSPLTDNENRELAAASKSPIWLRPAHTKAWTGRSSFSRFGTCAASSFFLANDPKWCPTAVADVANTADTSRGYWVIADQTNTLDVLCIGDADNEGYWTRPIIVSKSKPDEFDFTVAANKKTFQTYHDRTPRAIVRRGCMATFYWMNHIFEYPDHAELKNLRNIEYGDYKLPTYAAGTVCRGGEEGASRVICYCDPFETEKEKPAQTKCVDHHEWSEEKQRCVWTKDEMYAGEMHNYVGQKMLFSIPNWPLNKRFDINLKDANLPDFLFKVTRIIVRQGCFCTIYSGHHLASWQPRTTVNYGSHPVMSKYATEQPLAKAEQGALRIVCECMNEDSGKFRLVRLPELPQCVEMHKYNNETKRCEWTGSATGCMVATNTRNQKLELKMENWPSYPIGRRRLNAVFDKLLTYLTIRQGCSAIVWVNQVVELAYVDYKLVDNLAPLSYGTYRVPQKYFGDVEVGYANMGSSQVNCMCYDDLMILKRELPSTPCLAGHAYNEEKGICDWTRDRKIFAEIRNDKGETLELEMPNWPVERVFSWNMAYASNHPHYRNKAMSFLNRIVSILIRRHCFVTLYAIPDEPRFRGKYGPYYHTLGGNGTRTYGNFSVGRGTTRVVASCID